MEGLLGQAELHPLRRADAGGDPVRRRGRARNAKNAPLATASARWNFAVEDATPEIPLNEAIWKSVKGRRSEMPDAAPRLHHRLAARGRRRLAAQLVSRAVTPAVASFAEGTVALAAALAAAGVLVLREPRSRALAMPVALALAPGRSR